MTLQTPIPLIAFVEAIFADIPRHIRTRIALSSTVSNMADVMPINAK